MSRHYLVRYEQTGEAGLRERMRSEHIAYRKGLGDAISLAGPILDEDDRPVGSVIIIAAQTGEDAVRIATGDPYVAAGLLAIATIDPIRIAVMRPPAG